MQSKTNKKSYDGSGFGGKPKFERKNDRNSFGGGEKKGRDGDWDCPKCHNNNFAFRTECKRCFTAKDGTPGKGGDNNGTPRSNFGNKPGDWICSQCSNDNFAFRTECKRCNAPKGDSEVVPGERQNGGSGGRGAGFRGGRGGRGAGGRGGRGGRGGFDGGARKSFGGFENKSSPANKKIKFDE